jgi:hypothetical protein
MSRYLKTERGGGLFVLTDPEQTGASKSTRVLKLREVIPW